MNCDQVFDVLTRGPFPAGEASDVQVEAHLACCPSCQRLAAALQPALDLLQEAIPVDQRGELPGYWGDRFEDDWSASDALDAAPAAGAPAAHASSRIRGELDWWQPHGEFADRQPAVPSETPPPRPAVTVADRGSSPPRTSLWVSLTATLLLGGTLGVLVRGVLEHRSEAPPPPHAVSADAPPVVADRAGLLVSLCSLAGCSGLLPDRPDATAVTPPEAANRLVCCTDCHMVRLSRPLAGENEIRLAHSCRFCHSLSDQ